MTVLPADATFLRTQDDGIAPIHRWRALTVRPAAHVGPTLLFLGVAFALANGLGYGSGNHWQYLLHGRHALDPSLLANDWLTQTRPHHPAFHACIALVGRFMPLDVALGLANAVSAVLYVVCIFAIAARFYRSPIIITALVVLILVFNPQSAIGMSKNVHGYFEPSTIGAVGLLAAFVFLAARRYWGAALSILVAALFHLNYMIWAAVIFGAVVIFNWRRLGLRGSALLLVPIVLAAVYHLPFFAASWTPDQRAAYGEASRILHDVYMPGQSRPLTWGWEPFVRFGSILAAGIVAWLAVRPERRPSRVIFTILGAIAAIVVAGMFFTIVVPNDAVALLFPYRVAPMLILASQIAVAGALVSTTGASPLSLPKTLALWGILGILLYGSGLRTAYALTMIGAAIVVLLAGRLARDARISTRTAALVAVGLPGLLALGGAGKTGLVCAGAFLATALASRFLEGRWRVNPSWAPVSSAGRVILPLLVAALAMRNGATRKDFLGPPPPADEQLLYDWCRNHTDRTDLFVIPPLLSGFRLGAERAIVVDARCIPILPKDTLEWYRRLTDECGTGFDSLVQTEAKFASADASRARRLAEKYGARYLVARNGKHGGDLQELRRLYANPAFCVYDLGAAASCVRGIEGGKDSRG